MKTKTIFKHAVLASCFALSNSAFALESIKLANNVTMPSGVVKAGDTKFVTDHINGFCAIDEQNKSFFKLDSDGYAITSTNNGPEVINPLTGQPLLDCIKPTDLVAPGKPVSVTIGNDTYIFLVDQASPSSGGLWRLKYNTATGWDPTSLNPVTSFIDAQGKSQRPSSLAVYKNGNQYDLYIGTTSGTLIYKISNVTGDIDFSLGKTSFATTLSNVKGPIALEVLNGSLFILEEGVLTKVALNAQPSATITQTRIRGRIVTTQGPLLPPKATRVSNTPAGPVGMTQLNASLYYATFDSIYKQGVTTPICSNLPTSINPCFFEQFTDVTDYNNVALRTELGLSPITQGSKISLTIVSLDMIDGKLIIGDDDLVGAYGGEGMGHVWSITAP